MITGGTRGIGLNLGEWMIEQLGARNIVLLGRSGASGPAVQKVLRRYEGVEGVTVRAIACDVGDYAQVESALKSVADLAWTRPGICTTSYPRTWTSSLD